MRLQCDASELAQAAEILESPAFGLAVYVHPSGGRFQNLGFDGSPTPKNRSRGQPLGESDGSASARQKRSYRVSGRMGALGGGRSRT